MTDAEICRLARGWVAATAAQNPALGPRREHTDDEWYFISELLNLTADDWLTAFAVCVEVAKQTDDPWILANLGAGPLEDFLEARGSQAIEPFLNAAKINPAFRQALRHVWESSSPEVWAQFEKVRDRLTV